MTLSAVLVAAGLGQRMQPLVANKLLVPLQGRPLLAYTLEAFTHCKRVDEIVLVVAKQALGAMRERFQPLAPHVIFVPGGSTRRSSSMAGIRAARGDYVLVHDGARPFPSANLIDRVIEAMLEHGAAIPALPMHDALHSTEGDMLETHTGTMVSSWVRAQTPQGFRTDLVLPCLERSPDSVRDEAAAVLRHNLPVAWVAGDPRNVKVTVAEDLALADAIAFTLQRRS